MASSLSIDARIAQVTGAQNGFARAAQFRAIGVDSGAVRRRIAAGVLHQIAPELYAHHLVRWSSDHETRVRAAVLAMGPGAAAGFESAATRHGGWDRSDGTAWAVTRGRAPMVVPNSRRITTRNLPTSDVIIVDGLRTTTWERTIVDVGRTCTPHQIAWMIGRGVFLRKLDIPALSQRLDRTNGSPGTARSRRGLELHVAGSAGTRSRSEDQFLQHASQAVRIEPVVCTRGAAGLAYAEPDFVWPHAQAIVELDGSGHELPGARASDLARDIAHDSLGWRTLRVPVRAVWIDVEDLVQHVARWLIDPSSVAVQDDGVSPTWRLRINLDTPPPRGS